MNKYQLNMRNSLSIWRSLIACSLLFPLLVTTGFGDDQKLQASDRVGICGDGLTSPSAYAVYLQDYLQMCQPAAKLQIRVFDLAKDAKGCLDQQMLPAKLNAAAVIISLADFSSAHYTQKLTDFTTELKANGSHLIVIGSPFILDPDPNGAYGKMLADAEAVISAVKTGQGDGAAVADIAATMTDAAAKAASANSKVKIACSSQVNIPPGGSLAAAYTLLKALGCDGNIGTITLDMQTNQATATDGHKILGVANNTIDVESTRYPFCFRATDPNFNLRGALDFIPFNQDLNRFLLVVKNAPSKKLKVTWGNKSKEFTSDDLEKGVNLAAEFLDNPFLQPFADVDAKILAQQGFQLKEVGIQQRSLAIWLHLFPEEKETVDRLRQVVNQKIDSVVAEQEGMVPPVKHQIHIEAE